eukprot:Amastigsp_a509308_11.p3 type:complete len:103 gc:universal Amastigsp_a509308_11:651-343(-)
MQARQRPSPPVAVALSGQSEIELVLSRISTAKLSQNFADGAHRFCAVARRYTVRMNFFCKLERSAVPAAAVNDPIVTQSGDGGPMLEEKTGCFWHPFDHSTE